MTEALVRHEEGMPLERLGATFMQSGYFKDVKSAQQAIVKVLAGRELGIGPFSSQTALHIIEGKPVLSANLLAAAIKRTGKYTYRITRHDDKGCCIDFYERMGDKYEKVGSSEFTEKEMTAAQLGAKDNWKKYAKAMYFARAISQGQRWFAPDIFSTAVYTPDEMELTVNADGDAINVPVVHDIPKVEEKKEQKPLGTPADLIRKSILLEQARLNVPSKWLKDYAKDMLKGKAWGEMNEAEAQELLDCLVANFDSAAGRQPGQEGE